MASEPQPPAVSGTTGLAPAPEPSPALAHRADYRLVRTLLRLQCSAATGTLRVEAEGVTTVVRLKAGHPVFVGGGLPADSLGRLLVKQGKISEATLTMVEEERMLMQGRLRFGEVARRLGVIDTDALNQALRDQVRDKLVRCLHWERGEHVFAAEEHDFDSLPGPALAIEPLLLGGVARHYSGDRIQELLSPFWREPARLRADRELVCERFGFDADERAMLEQILTAPSVGHVMAGPASRNPRVAHVLSALALSDQLAGPDWNVPDESGPFVIDDTARTTRHTGRPADKGRETASSSTVPAAGPAVAEAVALPGKEKLLADSAFLQGKELLRAGEYGAAADAFREASNLRPTALEYALFAAWSAYLSTGRAGKWREMLSELCDRTLAQDRHLAFAHHVRGQLALESKDMDTAKQAFKRALELDPQDDEAKRLLDRMKN